MRRGNEMLAESNARVGATIAGRRTHHLSISSWGTDGSGGRARTPTFVVSHRPPADLPDGGVYTFRPEP